MRSAPLRFRVQGLEFRFGVVRFGDGGNLALPTLFNILKLPQYEG